MCGNGILCITLSWTLISHPVSCQSGLAPVVCQEGPSWQIQSTQMQLTNDNFAKRCEEFCCIILLFSFLWIFLLLWPLSFIFIELYTSEMIPSAAHTHTLVQAGAKKPPLPWLATAHLVLSSFRHPFLSPSASSTINQLLRPRFLFGPSWKTLYRPFPSSALHSSLAQSSELPCLLWKNSDEHYQV